MVRLEQVVKPKLRRLVFSRLKWLDERRYENDFANYMVPRDHRRTVYRVVYQASIVYSVLYLLDKVDSR